MKKLKIFLIGLTMFLTLGITNVNAATLKLKLQNGTVKSYEIAESEYSLTIKDFKEKVAKELGIDADHQVYTGIEDDLPEYDQVTLKDKFDNAYGFSTNEQIYNVYERKELEGDTLNVYSIPPIQNDPFSSYAIFEGTITRYYYGYIADTCNADYSKCLIKNASTGEDYKEMNIKFVYDSTTKNNVEDLIKKVETSGLVAGTNEIRFALKDLENVNYWVNKGSIINYSDEYKKVMDYKNFYLDIRAGAGETLYTENFGIGFYTVDNVLYKVIENIGIASENVLYVPTDTSDEKVLEVLQKRIDDYLGKGLVLIQKSDYNLDTYQGSESPETINKLKNISFDNNIYKAIINNEEYYFVISKNSDEMHTPELITSDFKTDITISSKDGSIPLDTMINVKNLVSGSEYERILNLLNIDNGKMFDISLFSRSLEKYITKLDNGTFEVKIPLTEEYKGKNLVVYYIDENNKKYEFEVKEVDGYAVFNTNHFSIYTLAEKSSNNVTNEVINPQTGDKLLSYITISSLALSGLILVSIKLKKDN